MTDNSVITVMEMMIDVVGAAHLRDEIRNEIGVMQAEIHAVMWLNDGSGEEIQWMSELRERIGRLQWRLLEEDPLGDLAPANIVILNRS
ncbi:hypothetical protein [Azospirillum brasilense]|uniref:Uncharacterized protein n=1 Tax=Azospirillum brasilense TaxID=192 RepID=A0A6L3ASD3_AZOBR|nr:hypothetical protein [Azospirillum brasilense]KAA0678209.1 hypothetical protein DS837_28240 [Azospirillum brasilense]